MQPTVQVTDQITDQVTEDSLSTQVKGAQVIGVLESDVLCIFLGRVWKMRSPRLSFVKKVNEAATAETTDVELNDLDSEH